MRPVLVMRYPISGISKNVAAVLEETELDNASSFFLSGEGRNVKRVQCFAGKFVCSRYRLFSWPVDIRQSGQHHG